MSRDADVIVVGGGPAGATSALRLARGGADVLLVDRARFPRAKPCAEYLSPEAIRELAAIDALAEVERAGGVRLAGMTVRAPDGTEFGARFGGIGIPREDLDAILLEKARAAGARVIEGFRVDALHRETTSRGGTRIAGVAGTDANGDNRILRAPLVVGADGLRSVVARRLGLARRARIPERYAVVGHFSGVHDVSDQVEMHVTSRGYVGIADVGGGRTSVAIVVPASLIGEARGDATGFFKRWLGSHPHLAPRFARAAPVGDVQATGPFASRARRAWAPGVALVGDAAGFFDPITGQGVASALRGAALLAPFAAAASNASDDAREADRALAAYGRAHRDAFRSQWLVDKLIALVVAHPALMDRAAHALNGRQGMADQLLGVTSGSRPTRDVLRPGFLLDLLRPVTR